MCYVCRKDTNETGPFGGAMCSKHAVALSAICYLPIGELLQWAAKETRKATKRQYLDKALMSPKKRS